MPRKKSQLPTVTLFYPNGVTISDLQHEVANDYNGKISDINFFLFFHLLSEPYFNIRTDSPGEYLQIHSDVLRCIFRGNHKSVIKDLVNAEYIQHNPAYSNATGLCKSYRIHPKRIDISAPFNYVIENADAHFLRKLTTLRSSNLAIKRDTNGVPIQRDAKYQHVIEQNANLMLVPNADALQYITEQYTKKGNINPAQYYFDYFNNDPLKRVAIDGFGFRLHTVITNMPKVIRQCLRFISAPMVPVRELDIVNSLPFFLSSVTAELVSKFVPESISAVPVFCRYEEESNFLKFKSLCQSGEIYEYLIGNFEMEYYTLPDTVDKPKRKYAKQLTFSALFGDYELKDANSNRECKSLAATINRDFFNLYKREFPMVYELFREVKALPWDFTLNKAGERKRYANNALLAQRLESGVMYGHIVTACIDNGYTEVVTIHDCLLVREDEAESIKSIADATFQALGLNPKFK